MFGEAVERNLEGRSRKSRIKLVRPPILPGYRTILHSPTPPYVPKMDNILGRLYDGGIVQFQDKLTDYLGLLYGNFVSYYSEFDHQKQKLTADVALSIPYSICALVFLCEIMKRFADFSTGFYRFALIVVWLIIIVQIYF